MAAALPGAGEAAMIETWRGIGMQHRWGWAVAMLAIGAGWPGVAVSDELVAVRPGVMCASADALARLTLPNGDSRTHGPGARPADVGIASAGGCIDIPPGARVTVQQAFHNTSRVTYAGPGAPADGLVTVPNVDFQPAGAASAPTPPGVVVPPGYAVIQRMPVGNLTLLVLMDRRITPALRDAGWGTDQYGPALDAQFEHKPPLNAQLVLLSGDGTVLARRTTERDRAKLEPSPVHRLPTPTVMFTVDYSAGMGGYNGPFGELLAPVEHGLSPVEATPIAGGANEPIALIQTMHAIWQVVPARSGGPEEIEVATCPNDNSNGTGSLRLRTYRFQNGHWTFASRKHGECGELESSPDRRDFP